MENKNIMNSETEVKAVETIENGTEKTAANVDDANAADYDSVISKAEAKKNEKALLKGKGTAEQYQEAGAYDVDVTILRRIDADMNSVTADNNYKLELRAGKTCIEYDFSNLKKVANDFMAKAKVRINLPKLVDDLNKIGSMNSDRVFAMRNFHNSTGWCEFEGLDTFTFNNAVNAGGIIESTYRGEFGIECKGDSDTFWKGVADIIHDKPQLTLLIAASVSGVVISFPGLNLTDSNLTMDVYGVQGTGKTTAVHLASAIWGNPSTLHFPPNSTTRSIEMELGKRGVIPTTVDDISAAAIVDTKFKNLLVKLIFAASQGKSYATCNDESKSFYGPLLLSSEYAIHSMIRNNITTGQNFRLLEICSEKPGFMDRETSKKIENLIADNYGHIIGFVKRLLENGFNAKRLNDMIKEEIDILEENFSTELTGRERFKNRLSLVMTCVNLLDSLFDMQIDISEVRKVLIACIVKQIPVVNQHYTTGEILFDIIADQFSLYREYFADYRQKCDITKYVGYVEEDIVMGDRFVYIYSDYLKKLARHATAADIALNRPAKNVIELTDKNIEESFVELVEMGLAFKRSANSKNLTSERVVMVDGKTSKEHFYKFNMKDLHNTVDEEEQ